jgi:hypothetical protein
MGQPVLTVPPLPSPSHYFHISPPLRAWRPPTHPWLAGTTMKPLRSLSSMMWVTSPHLFLWLGCYYSKCRISFADLIDLRLVVLCPHGSIVHWPRLRTRVHPRPRFMQDCGWIQSPIYVASISRCQRSVRLSKALAPGGISIVVHTRIWVICPFTWWFSIFLVNYLFIYGYDKLDQLQIDAN